MKSEEDTSIFLPEEPKAPESISSTVLNAPLRITGYAISTSWGHLRPYAPLVVPVLVYLSFLPFVSFLSFSTGVIVWRRIAVGWEIPLYLQYG